MEKTVRRVMSLRMRLLSDQKHDVLGRMSLNFEQLRARYMI